MSKAKAKTPQVKPSRIKNSRQEAKLRQAISALGAEKFAKLITFEPQARTVKILGQTIKLPRNKNIDNLRAQGLVVQHSTRTTASSARGPIMSKSAYEEFNRKLQEDLSSGRITDAEADDLRRQRQLFDENRKSIERDYNGKFVGFAGSELISSDSFNELLKIAKAKRPGQLLYCEPVGFDLF